MFEFENRGQLVLHPRIAASQTVDRLTDTLTQEDAAEESGALSPHARCTCAFHRRWLHQCVASPAHAMPVTGHRWCRSCNVAAEVAIDELSGTVTLTCPRCRRFPDSMANRQLVRSCQASLAGARRKSRRLASVPDRRQAA
ncbi:MAG TPA: hypothetical protein VJT49_15870 [Amycolatopsis sp.]|uniref:hypothetical protein n=1 Tax=Amycolatopsis sp. TaxID=37632 RepID=UPI002B49A4D6|nr:hypothetical protein [Amycolatopsis sp.]HKS46556.1 hypothetical protein [Amycolatopsis sp.]